MAHKSDIAAFLRHNRQPPIMEDFSHDQSRYLSAFADRGRKMCGEENADFVILQNGGMKAFAAQDGTDFVAMYAGMFWMLSRLAASVAASDAFPDLEGAHSRPYSPDPERSLRTPRELLNEATPFDWDVESAEWVNARERVALYYFSLDILFKFVVFHELGHLHNDHGRRKTTSKNLGEAGQIVAVDELGPPSIDNNQGVASQAREIIADCTGLEMTLRVFYKEWELNDGEELNIIFSKIIPDVTRLIFFVLTIINLYFRLSDRCDWMEKPLENLSHSPAPMRMNALFAYVLDSRPLGIDIAAAKSVNQNARDYANQIMSSMLNILRAPDWAHRTQTSDWSAHYQLVYEESANWIGPLKSE